MTIIKPLSVALTGSLVLLIPFQDAQAATFTRGIQENNSAITDQLAAEFPTNPIPDLNVETSEIISTIVDEPENSTDFLVTNDFIEAEPEAVEEIPEPSTLVSLLFMGLFPILDQKKQ